MLHHVPPRCSRRRPGDNRRPRLVTYLTSPVQPAVGWRYLQAVYSVMQSVDIDPALRPVPARQISFQNNLTRTIFDEVHRLGQWVVNYDDLLSAAVNCATRACKSSDTGSIPTAVGT